MLAEAARVEVIRLPWSQLLGGAALLVRMGAFLAVAPVFGTAAAPPQLRAGFAVLLTALLLPVVPAPDLAAGVFGLVVGEAFVGLLLGFSALMVVEVAAVAGDFVGYPTGLSLAQQLDPVTQGEATTASAFYRLTGLLVFLAIGGHRQMLAALAETCSRQTRICIAADLTLNSERIEVRTAGDWKGDHPEFHKRPAVFLLSV